MPMYGENHRSAKLTESDVRVMRNMRNEGMQLKYIAKLFRVSKSVAGRAINRITWRRVE